MSNNFDYGFDVNTVEEIKADSKKEVQTNEVGDRTSNGNEYYIGEKEAIDKWLKSHKKTA